MDKTQAEQLLTELIQPIFSFALRRCASVQDAEDLAQDVTLRAFRALLKTDKIADPVRYVWTIARHTLANHYRDKARVSIGIPEYAADPTDVEAAAAKASESRCLQQQIARLGHLQRLILTAYYFDGRKQADIAAHLGIPEGTVKWHLYEAKKELKSSMENIRPRNHLSFAPVRFTAFSTDGSLGAAGDPVQHCRSAMAQNILYATRHRALTINELAESLGVSPVYVEDEVYRLADFGFLNMQHGTCLSAILVDEDEDDAAQQRAEVLQAAAQLMAPALLQALRESDCWSDEALYVPQGDRELALWSLLPYLLAQQDEQPDGVRFEDAATLRPDGGRNICCAVASASALPTTPADARLTQFSGPCWNATERLTLWGFDCCYTDRRFASGAHIVAQRELSLLQRMLDGEALSPEECTFLAERGLIRVDHQTDGLYTTTLLPVWIRSEAQHTRLLQLRREVLSRLQPQLDTLIQPYAQAMLARTPKHLRTARQYTLQSLLSGGHFIMHCLCHCVDSGLMDAPQECHRRSLSRLLITK